MPTVLFVDHDKGRSGATVSMEYLIRAFAAGGWTVYVLTPKAPAETACIAAAGGTPVALNAPRINNLGLNLHFSDVHSPFSASGMAVIAKNAVKFIVGIVVIWRVARRLRAGLVYANEYVVIQASVAACVSRIPAVVHVRSLMLRGALGIRRKFLAHLILSCNKKVFAISRLEAEQIVAKGKQKGRIEIVGEFVESPGSCAEAGSRWRKTIGLAAEKILVTMVGGVDPIKGSLEFLQSASLIGKSGPPAVFALAGYLSREGSPAGSPYHEECMRMITTLRDNGSLVLLGFVEDSMSLIAGSDIIVVPSTVSHFSRPVIEAWACAKPVVTTATEHMRDLVEDGQDGLLVPVGDPGAIAGALSRLIVDRDMRVRLGLAGRKKARSRFDANRNTEQILGWCGVLAGGPSDGSRGSAA